MNYDHEVFPYVIRATASKAIEAHLRDIESVIEEYVCKDNSDKTFILNSTMILQALETSDLNLGGILRGENTLPEEPDGPIPPENQRAARALYWSRKNDFLIQKKIHELLSSWLVRRFMQLFHKETWAHVTTTLGPRPTPAQIWDCAMAKHLHYINLSPGEAEKTLREINLDNPKYADRGGITKFHADFNDAHLNLNMVRKHCQLPDIGYRQIMEWLMEAYGNAPAFQTMKNLHTKAVMNPESVIDELYLRNMQREAHVFYDEQFKTQTEPPKGQANSAVATPKEERTTHFYSDGTPSKYKGPNFNPNYRRGGGGGKPNNNNNSTPREESSTPSKSKPTRDSNRGKQTHERGYRDESNDNRDDHHRSESSKRRRSGSPYPHRRSRSNSSSFERKRSKQYRTRSPSNDRWEDYKYPHQEIDSDTERRPRTKRGKMYMLRQIELPVGAKLFADAICTVRN
jgi:hypothetical protein